MLSASGNTIGNYEENQNRFDSFFGAMVNVERYFFFLEMGEQQMSFIVELEVFRFVGQGLQFWSTG